MSELPSSVPAVVVDVSIHGLSTGCHMALDRHW